MIASRICCTVVSWDRGRGCSEPYWRVAAGRPMCDPPLTAGPRLGSALGEGPHRVPGGQHDGLLVEGLAQLVGKRAAGDRDLEDVLVEPRVVHGPEAHVGLLGAPRVLDPPAGGHLLVARAVDE